MIDEETMTSEFFEAWFQKFLLPTLGTPSVIIMDNSRFHRMSKLELLCEDYEVLFVLSLFQLTIFNKNLKITSHIRNKKISLL